MAQVLEDIDPVHVFLCGFPGGKQDRDDGDVAVLAPEGILPGPLLVEADLAWSIDLTPLQFDVIPSLRTDDLISQIISQLFRVTSSTVFF